MSTSLSLYEFTEEVLSAKFKYFLTDLIITEYNSVELSFSSYLAKSHKIYKIIADYFDRYMSGIEDKTKKYLKPYCRSTNLAIHRILVSLIYDLFEDSDPCFYALQINLDNSRYLFENNPLFEKVEFYRKTMAFDTKTYTNWFVKLDNFKLKPIIENAFESSSPVL